MKKEKLMKAGLFYYSINGIEATRIEDITRRAGVAKGTFYTYFKSKEDLLEQVFVEKMEDYKRLFDELKVLDGTMEDKIKYYLRKRFTKFVEDPCLFFMILSLRRTGEMGILIYLKKSLGKRGGKLILEFVKDNIDSIKEKYRDEIELIVSGILASLFTYQDILAERIVKVVDESIDYEEVSKQLKSLDIEKYINYFYDINVREILKED